MAGLFSEDFSREGVLLWYLPGVQSRERRGGNRERGERDRESRERRRRGDRERDERDGESRKRGAHVSVRVCLASKP